MVMVIAMSLVRKKTMRGVIVGTTGPCTLLAAAPHTHSLLLFTEPSELSTQARALMDSSVARMSRVPNSSQLPILPHYSPSPSRAGKSKSSLALRYGLVVISPAYSQ